MPRTIGPFWTFAGIGLAGGFFSALFGVGGGIVVVPLLIFLAGFGPKSAAATSLVIIGITALFGVAAFGVLGEVRWREAAIVGFPAMVGTLGGTWLQQRISSRALVLLFAALLVAIAIELIAG